MFPKHLLLIFPAFTSASHYPHVVHPRQTSAATPTNDVLSACLEVLNPALASFPTLPPGIVSAMALNTITNGCDYTPAATIAPVFTSVEKYVVWWVSESLSLVESALEKACPPEVSTQVAGLVKGYDAVLCTDRVKEVMRTQTGDFGEVTTQSWWDTETVNLEFPVRTRTLEESSSGTLTEKRTTESVETTGTVASIGVTTTRSVAGARETGMGRSFMPVAIGVAGAVLAL